MAENFRNMLIYLESIRAYFLGEMSQKSNEFQIF